MDDHGPDLEPEDKKDRGQEAEVLDPDWLLEDQAVAELEELGRKLKQKRKGDD